MRGLDPDASGPPYRDIANALREALDAGEWAPGEAIYSRKQLVGHFGVSGMTVQRAVGVLVDEGRLVARQGARVYVRAVPDPPARDLAAELDELRARLDVLERRVPPG
ncbi:GntR family transcriptional regulator [Actinokineospora cianjurensis]|uniref:Regulatory GntR family protein n=1 Tax=Actinokineospora cianjurensis TaxID=585224 RepID=A0A421B2B2_9PSEU|nr:GntR family transcriptional regulator [Actinokineospora cianjurensis]RLK58401.1 regulatory GntR family protein [Actinokineospora cianjurensis]